MPSFVDCGGGGGGGEGMEYRGINPLGKYHTSSEAANTYWTKYQSRYPKMGYSHYLEPHQKYFYKDHADISLTGMDYRYNEKAPSAFDVNYRDRAEDQITFQGRTFYSSDPKVTWPRKVPYFLYVSPSSKRIPLDQSKLNLPANGKNSSSYCVVPVLYVPKSASKVTLKTDKGNKEWQSSKVVVDPELKRYDGEREAKLFRDTVLDAHYRKVLKNVGNNIGAEDIPKPYMDQQVYIDKPQLSTTMQYTYETPESTYMEEDELLSAQSVETVEENEEEILFECKKAKNKPQAPLDQYSYNHQQNPKNLRPFYVVPVYYVPQTKTRSPFVQPKVTHQTSYDANSRVQNCSTVPSHFREPQQQQLFSECPGGCSSDRYKHCACNEQTNTFRSFMQPANDYHQSSSNKRATNTLNFRKLSKNRDVYQPQHSYDKIEALSGCTDDLNWLRYYYNRNSKPEGRTDCSSRRTIENPYSRQQNVFDRCNCSSSAHMQRNSSNYVRSSKYSQPTASRVPTIRIPVPSGYERQNQTYPELYGNTYESPYDHDNTLSVSNLDRSRSCSRPTDISKKSCQTYTKPCSKSCQVPSRPETPSNSSEMKTYPVQKLSGTDQNDNFRDTCRSRLKQRGSGCHAPCSEATSNFSRQRPAYLSKSSISTPNNNNQQNVNSTTTACKEDDRAPCKLDTSSKNAKSFPTHCLRDKSYDEKCLAVCRSKTLHSTRKKGRPKSAPAAPESYNRSKKPEMATWSCLENCKRIVTHAISDLRERIMPSTTSSSSSLRKHKMSCCKCPTNTKLKENTKKMSKKTKSKGEFSSLPVSTSSLDKQECCSCHVDYVLEKLNEFQRTLNRGKAVTRPLLKSKPKERKSVNKSENKPFSSPKNVTKITTNQQILSATSNRQTIKRASQTSVTRETHIADMSQKRQTPILTSQRVTRIDLNQSPPSVTCQRVIRSDCSPSTTTSKKICCATRVQQSPAQNAQEVPKIGQSLRPCQRLSAVDQTQPVSSKSPTLSELTKKVNNTCYHNTRGKTKEECLKKLCSKFPVRNPSKNFIATHYGTIGEASSSSSRTERNTIRRLKRSSKSSSPANSRTCSNKFSLIQRPGYTIEEEEDIFAEDDAFCDCLRSIDATKSLPKNRDKNKPKIQKRRRETPKRETSQSSIKKEQTRGQTPYRFVPLNESYGSAPEHNLSYEVDPEEPQLPHYVVPVLYVPQRIITNEELLSSQIYDQFGQDSLDRQSYSVKAKMSPHQSAPFQEDLYYQVSQDNSAYISRSSGTHIDVHSRLTDSETEIYERLMERLYGFRNRQAEKDFHQDPSKPNHVASSNRTNIEAEPDYEDSLFNDDSVTNSGFFCTPSCSSKHNRIVASSFNQEYVVKNSPELPPYDASTSAYTVHPATSADFQRHELSGDYGVSRSTTPPKHRCSNTIKAQSPVTSQAIVQEKIVFDMDLTNEGDPFESKCTQTAMDISIATATQTGDHVFKKSRKCQMPEKRPVKRRTKGKCTNSVDANLTVAAYKRLKEGVHTTINEQTRRSEVPEETAKAATSIPSVDLLPVESSTLEPVVEKTKFVPKLRTQSRFSCPSSIPLQQ